jgi:hypothetical protein
MIQQEQWEFWSARAFVARSHGSTHIDLRGIITAQVYEALHKRIGTAAALGMHTLSLGWPALLATTNISAMDAAVRGSPASVFGCGSPMTIRVPAARLQWATDHCAIMTRNGLLRRASVSALGQTRLLSAA